MARKVILVLLLVPVLVKSIMGFADPQLAKQRGQFWLMTESGAGEATAATEGLIEDIYPGYGRQLSADAAFWPSFFSETFSTYVWLQAYSRQTDKKLRTFIPWLSCFEIIEKYGTDVVIFGSSETFSSIIPAILKQGFPPQTRILMCSVDSMQVEHVFLSAKLLQKLTKKPIQAVIWGYSLWNAFTRSAANRQSLREKLDLFHKSRYTSLTPYTSNTHRWVESANRWPKAWFPQYSWDMVAPFSSRIREWSRSVRIVPETYPVLSKKVFDNEQELENFTERTKPYFSRMLGMSERDCNLESSKVLLREALSELEKVAQQIILFVPPTRLTENITPDCFQPSVEALLRGFQSDTIQPIVKNWNADGIQNKHFLWETSNADTRVYNFNHLNFTGATRLTTVLVKELLSRTKGRNLSKAHVP